VKERKVTAKLVETFESDWAANKDKDLKGKIAEQEKEKPAKKMRLEKKLDPLGETIKRAVKKVVKENGHEVVADDETKETLKQAVKKTVKQAFKEAVQETAARVEDV
jgi:predicted metal-dependent hydrolase